MDPLRAELVRKLGAYLDGELSLSDLLGWEVVVNDESAKKSGLRFDLDRVALLGEEIADGIRPEADLLELAIELTGRDTRARRGA